MAPAENSRTAKRRERVRSEKRARNSVSKSSSQRKSVSYSSFEGEPTTTAEARPEWFAIEDVPYDRMWEDDRYWLPGVLEGKTVRGEFRFEGGEPLDEAELVDYDLEWSVSFSEAHP